MSQAAPLRLAGKPATPDERLESKVYRYFLKEPCGDWLATVMMDARGQVFWNTNGWGAVGYRWDAAGEIRTFLLRVTSGYLFEKFSANIVGGLADLPYVPEGEDVKDESDLDHEEAHGIRQRRILEVMIDRVLPALKQALADELQREGIDARASESIG